jgi:hypothetical protein
MPPILPHEKARHEAYRGGGEYRLAQAIVVACYNFGRKHEAPKNTVPAMASKLTDHVWTIKELIEMAAGARTKLGV